MSAASFARPPASSSSGIDHVAIAVHNPEDAADWYARNFGMTVVNDEIVCQGLNVRLMFLASVPDAGASSLQLISPIGDGPVADYLRDHGEGLHHLCLAVPNITEALTALGEPVSQIFKGGYGLPCAFLEGNTPAGTRVELVERLSPPEDSAARSSDV